MQLIDFDGLVAQGKLIKSTDINPANDLLIVGKLLPPGTGALANYVVYTVPISQLPGGGASSIEITMDITGKSSIDMTGLTGNYIVNLTSSNSTEIINSIVNASGVGLLTLRPAAGLTPTFNDIINGGTNIKLMSGTVSPIGTNFGFLELTKRGSNFFQTNFIDQYIS